MTTNGGAIVYREVFIVTAAAEFGYPGIGSHEPQYRAVRVPYWESTP